MKILVIYLSILFAMQSITATAQIENGINYYSQFDQLMKYKRQYEKYRNLAEKNENFSDKRDSVYTLYTSKIKSMQKKPEMYLKHLEEVIRTNDAKSKDTYPQPYDYFDTSLPFDSSLHFVKRVDLYKIIKKYIFDEKANLLPEKINTIKKINS